jgi:hypothetical protein
VARYSSKQIKPDAGGLWYEPSDAFLENREAWELPRTCKKCKAEKPAEEFHGKKGTNVYSTWCRGCRSERWKFLKAQRKPKKEPVPKFAEVVKLALEYGDVVENVTLSSFTAEECRRKLQKLQEEYTWTAVKKR